MTGRKPPGVFDPDTPRLLENLLEQVRLALAEHAAGLPVLNFDVTTMFVPLADGSVHPCPVAVIIAAGASPAPGKELAGWARLTGWTPSQQQVDDTIAEALGNLRRTRDRLSAGQNGGSKLYLPQPHRPRGTANQ